MATYNLSDDPNKPADTKAGSLQARYNEMIKNPNMNTISAPDYTQPTDVVSTSGRTSAVNLQTNYQPDLAKKEAGLRATFMPTKTLGFNPLTTQQKQSMQQKYRDIANMRGLSNRQRQNFLIAQAGEMAKHGISPTHDLTSNKGLSQRQIMANDLNMQNVNQQALDTAQTMRESMWNWRRDRDYYRDNYEGMLWE